METFPKNYTGVNLKELLHTHLSGNLKIYGKTLKFKKIRV